MKKNKKANTNLISILFAAPYLILFFLFTVLPIIIAIFVSFTYYNILEAPVFTGLTNYSRLILEDEVFLIAIKNTFVFAVIIGPVSYLACLLIAWMINEFKPKMRAFLTLLFYAPSISGAVYVIWGIIFSGDSYGIVNNVLKTLGIIDEPIQWLQNPKYVLGVLIIVQIWLSLGTSFLAFIAGLQGIDRTLYEAGSVDGIKNRWQELWYITLPTMKPQLLFGAVIQITASFSVSEVCTNLAGFPSVDYSAHTIVTHLMDYGTNRFDLGMACAIATMLFIIMITTNKIVHKVINKLGN